MQLSFETLFEPIKIRDVELKNRIEMCPMATNLATEAGHVTKRLKDYYLERAKGGVAMIITECCYVHPTGRHGLTRLGIYDDKLVSGLRNLVSTVHANKAKIACQLHHGGRVATPEIIGEYPVAASSIPCQRIGVIPRTLRIGEIEKIVEAFGEGGRRAKEAGFDAVQIHAGHGYLLWSFLSPIANKRNDKYGGNLENNMRLLLEVVERVRERIGNMPLMVRINADDHLDGGLTLKETEVIAKKLEDVSVDVINITAGTPSSHEYEVPARAIPEGCNVHLSAAIKKIVSIPVSVAGNIKSPEMAEKILKEGKADLIDIGRALIADPDWPNKASAGRLGDIRTCIGCKCCSDSLRSGHIRCAVNAAVGREAEYKIRLARKPKKVLVAGGGLAGLEAARVCALRGHKVTLYEKNMDLGGQFSLAAVTPYKRGFKELISYFENQLRKLGVRIELGQEVTAELVKKAKPDVVIIATGAAPAIPKIQGVKLWNVVTALDVLKGVSKVGEKVVVIGGGLVGTETADLLSEEGKEVIIVARSHLHLNIANSNNLLLLRRLLEKGVRILINAKMKKIERDSVVVERKREKERIKVDTVVMATGMRANRKLIEELQGSVPEVYAIGDCIEPRGVLEAIYEGSRIARYV